MASLIKRGRNYYLQILQGDKRIRRCVGPDKKVAEAICAKIDHETALARAAGQPWTGADRLVDSRQPRRFREAAEEYMAERQHYKKSTVQTYESILKCYLVPGFGNLLLSEITEARIARFQAKLAKDVSPARANTVISLLHSVLETARRRREIPYNPTEGVRKLRQPKTKVDPLSEEELARVLKAIDPHFYPLFVTLAYTGARPNELLALRWTDIDFKLGLLRITKGRVRGEEGLPKTAASERDIPLLSPVVTALHELQSRPVVAWGDYVFTDKSGRPINKHLDRIWAKALRKAGLRHRPSYQLRHTFASLCLLKGLAPGYIARLLGHTTLETFYRHYARWIEQASASQELLLKQSFSAGNDVRFDNP